MGYDLHITRAGEWSESETRPIPLAEWLAYVGQDDELKQEPHAEVISPEGETIRIPGEGLALWAGHPEHAANGTTTAWYNEDYRGLPFGRVHWVAIVPEMQGRGLAKPIMSAVCHRLRELGHGRAYLTTTTVRIP